MPTPKRDSQHTMTHERSTDMTSSLGHQKKKDHIPMASSSTLPPLESQERLTSRPVFMKEPPPGRALSTENLSPNPSSLSVLELPRLVAEVGHEKALGDSMWMEGPRLMASAMAADFPVSPPEVSAGKATEETAKGDSVSMKKTTDTDKDKDPKTRTRKCSKHKEPLTGIDVVEIFAKCRHLGKLQFYHLQATHSGPYRPYHLHVVPQTKAGSEHYIFSPTSVLHVKDGCSVGLLTLAEWHREAVLWNALQDIPFFGHYLLRKAFMRWHGHMCKLALQRRCEVLQGLLLMAVPLFRNALFHFSRLLEELKGVHWLPQAESKTYTLLDFQNILLKKNQECRTLLEKFLQYRALILNMVQTDSYGAHQELQLRVERALMIQRSQPLHLQQAHVRGLKKELGRAECVLQQLGNMAALADQMIVQSLVTITHREVLSFLNNVMKREKPQQGCLFEAELIFGADGRLTLFPPMHLFQEVVHGALSSVADSALQVFDTYSYSPDTKDCVTASNSFISAAPELTSDLSLTSTGGLAGVTGISEQKESELTGVGSSSSRPGVRSAPRLVLPQLNPLRVQGQRLRGQYYPLSKTQLEWQLRLNSGAEEMQEELDRIMQKAKREVQELCEGHVWLVDIHLFTSQWSPASLEVLRGSSASCYQEHIQKVRHWTERICTVPSSVTTSNKLLLIHSSQIQETLGPLLTSIEEDVLGLLVGEVKLRSENLTQELKRAVDGLRIEPTDFNDFTHYASMVERCEAVSTDMQHQLEYLNALQDTIRMNYRQTTRQEVVLEEQMMDLWDCFVPLLKRAAETVNQRLPSMADTLDHTFSTLAHDLEDMVSTATSGPFLDPRQSATQMLAELKIVCRQVYAISTRLGELSRTSNSLRGNPLDLAFVVAAQQTITMRKGLWELMAASTAQIQEWRLLLFTKFVVSRAQEKVDEWLQQAVSLARYIPPQDAVLQETLQVLEHFNLQLPVLTKLSSPTLKHKHWKNIFQGMGLLYAPQWSLTVADLMSKKLVEHQDKITKICREAKAEADMEQAFRKLQRSWEGALFRLAKFIVTEWQEDKPQAGATRRKKPSTDTVSNHPSQKHHSRDSGTFTIIGLETLLAQTEDSVMTLSNMLLCPHVAEFRHEVEHWVQQLQELEELLDSFERYQQKWVFLSKMFYETTVSVQKAELLERFQPVDKTFRDVIQTTSSDPHVLNIVRLKKVTETTICFHGDSLRGLLKEGLNTMESISNQLLYLLDSPRGEFPRLCFLSDGEVIKLLSLHPTPSSLLPLVRKCFRGVRWLEVDSKRDASHDVTELSSGLDLSDTQMWVRGVYGSLREHVSFLSPLAPSLNPLAWLGLLEQRLNQAMMELMKQYAVARHLVEPLDKDPETDRKVGDTTSPDTTRFSSPSDLLRKEEKQMKRANDLPCLWSTPPDYPLQCVLVAEEALWCSEVRKAYQASTSVKWSRIKARNSSKIQSMCQTVRDSFTGSTDRSLHSQYTMTVLRSLLLLTMNHSQRISKLMEVKGDLESSFEWQSLMKYNIILHNRDEATPTQQSKDAKEYLCYVEVLGAQLAYGYEYLGPDHWVMVNTPSTDRAILGILLALTSYRCGFVSGPCMSGKRKTVAHVGRALGRQVVSLHCGVNTSPSVVQQMLLGALQTGAWLVLDSVDLMTQGALSLLGQHLSDIHQSLSCLQRNTQQSVSQPESRDPGKGCQKSDELEMSFAGKNIFAKLNYGCVIISSRGYWAEVPENLRGATRPTSLAHPDYTIITEVMLASLGFSEAASLSRCLVSLLTMARDSLCLPEAISGEQTSWLVLLRNIIAAAGATLQSTKRQEMMTKEKELRDEAYGQSPSLDVLLNPSETDERNKEGDQSNYKRINHSAALIQGMMEEQAVVKGVSSVLASAIYEHNKDTKFRTLFEEIFPTARSYLVLQEYTGEQNLLRSAVTEELQQTGFHADITVLQQTLSLYQAMKLSRAVLLVGPSGCGKTTCYRALAGALRQLAARVEEVEFAEEVSPNGGGPDMDYQPTTSDWCSVDTVVLFPNALSHEELFGGCHEQQGSWWDGAFTKVLKDSERQDFSASAPSNRKKKRGQTRKVKWLVMDGEPLGQPGWLDPFSTLCTPEDPFLCLSSGEKVRPSHEELKLLAEVSDLADASPTAVTRCSVVVLSGKELWKSVWKAEMEAQHREHTLDQGTLNMWIRLAEDLFSCTLTFLRHKSLTPVMHSEAEGPSTVSNGITSGLQEVMSFIRILHALLEQFGKGRGLKASRQSVKRDMPLAGNQSSSTDVLIPSTEQELQARNIFLVAYIWGFGGHIHPRHWPQFDLLVRDALFKSRYRVEVPAEGTVFDHFFNLSDGMLGDTSYPMDSSRSKSPMMACTVIPQYEKHGYVLDLMLEARQPALLVGEVGSGKSVLCQSLLSADRPHVRLTASPRLRSTDLRNILEGMGCKKTTMGTTGTLLRQTAGQLLFVEDLHEAPHDAFGKTSMALETLRQCISRGGVLTADGFHFKLFSSGAISYLGTCSTSGGTRRSCNSISSRLSRLFSVFALPSLSVDVLFSIHSPRIQNWLKEFPCMPKYADMARCIITATVDLYHLVCKHFQPSPQQPHFLFSHHDLQKVFQGMCLWAPRTSNRHTVQKKVSLRAMVSSSALPCLSPVSLGPAASVLNMTCLWMHECLRTFGDRLCSEEETKTLVSLIAQVSEENYSSRMTVKPPAARAEETSSSPTPITSPSITSDQPNSSDQRPASPSQTEMDSGAMVFKHPSMSPLPTEPNEQEELDQLCDRQSYSDSSSSESGSTDNVLGETNKTKQVKRKKRQVLKTSEKEQHHLELSHDTAAHPCQGVSHDTVAHPPMGPTPSVLSDKKKSHKLAEDLSPAETRTSAGPELASSRVFLQLLQDMRPTMHTMVYSPELIEPLSSMAQQHNFKRNSSYQERDLGLLVQQLALTVRSKEEEEEEESDDSYSSASSYSVHRQRVRQLAHVLRALLLPGGHGLLFGAVKGTGRKTTVRLAAYLTGYHLIEVHPGNQGRLRDMLKEAGGQAGVHGDNVMILVHEEISQECRDELLVVMANGTFTGLYSEEELRILVLKINALVKNTRSRLRDDQALEKYFKQLQRNIHMFLLLPLCPDSSGTQADRASVTLAHMARALCLCCCVEVYQPWSSDSLVQAASRRLTQNLNIPISERKVDRDSLGASISKVMAEIHQSAWKYASVLLPDLQPFTPQSFVELQAHFFHLCSHLSGQGQGQANRVATILARVKDMTDTAEQYRQEVIRLRDKLAETEQSQYQLQTAITAERIQCERSRQHCVLEENRLSHLEEQSHQAQLQAEDAFKEVSPLYQTALAALQSLSQNDLDEVRRYRVPPEGVVIVMDAICMLFSCPRNWESSKQLLGHSNFCQELEFYDRSRLNDELFQELGEIVQRKEFHPQAVRGVSRACESLCRWVRAVYQYTCVQRHMEPQDARKVHLDMCIAESRSRLCVARLQEEETREHIDNIEKELQVLRGDLEELAVKLRKAETLDRDAANALQQVAGYITAWTASAKETEMNNQTIPGDALLLAATITYLGPFGLDVRLELLRKWRELCLTGEISITPDDPRMSLLPESSSEPPQSSSEPPQSSSEPPQSSSKPLQTSSEPPQSSSKPLQTSSEPPQSSSKPLQTSSEAPQSSSKPLQTSSEPPQSSSQPLQTSSQPPQSSSQLPQSSSVLPQSSSEPPQLPKPLDHVPLPVGELQMALARAVGVDQHHVQGVHPRLLLKLLMWGYRGPWAQHWPLLADVQQRRDSSAHSMLLSGQLAGEDSPWRMEEEYGLVVSADDPSLLDKVSQAAEKGMRVLVTHVERAVPTPEFLEMLVRPAGSQSPGFRRPVLKAQPEYCLFLSTCLPVRLLLTEIHPSILSEVRVLDLSLGTEEVKELILTELVQVDCLELWVQHCLVRADRQTLQDKLCQEEMGLMEYILQSFTPLLQDPHFLPRVSACQTACHKLQSDILELDLELEHHMPLLSDFHRVAELATGLYQALQEVARLSPTYHFTLKGFLFNVRGALALKGRADAACSGEVLTGAVTGEISYRMVSHLLAQYRPCLFQSHASLFRLLVSVTLFQHNEPCSEVEKTAFLRGLHVDTSSQHSPQPSISSLPPSQHDLPSWLPPHTLPGVLRLEKIPAFSGLLSSLATFPKQWKEYLRYPSSTMVGPVPCRSHSHLSTLQRALLWRTLLPHWLAAVSEDLAACHLGQPVRSAVAGAPHTSSPEALSRFLSKHEGPVVVTLPGPGTEGTASVQPLHWLKQVAQYQGERKGALVKVISFGGKCQKEIVLSAFTSAVRHGHWLVFNNCHLLDQWDVDVVTQFNQLMSFSAKVVEAEEGLIPKGRITRVHPRFRLWFITRGYSPLAIPPAVRVCALRLVCDSPWDLKEQLCSSLHQVLSAALPASVDGISASPAGISASSLEPLLRSAILHSVLLQRQAYKHLGQGHIYNWTQEDLLALVDAHVRVAKHCDDPTGALEYIAANLVYGGHVSDLADLEAVESVARACLHPAPPLWGCGPHALSGIIHMHGRFDAAGLQQGLEHRVQALSNTGDPLVLGFSAGLSVELVKIHSHTINALLLHSQRPSLRAGSPSTDLPHPGLLPDVSQARDRLRSLKDSLVRKEESSVSVALGPMRHFLQAEWDSLIDLVTSLLSELTRPIRRSHSTASSLPTFTHLSSLERRGELLSTYLWDEIVNGPPIAYHLSAFSNARGFLAALIREAAKAKQREMSHFSLHFQVLSFTSSPSSVPLSGVCLCGLELRGAIWDTRLSALQDTLSPQPCLLPLLRVRAQVRNTDAVRAPDSPPSNTSSLPLYNCPLYQTGGPHDDDWGLSDSNIVTHVPLMAKLDPVLCSLRRVRLVSTL